MSHRRDHQPRQYRSVRYIATAAILFAAAYLLLGHTATMNTTASAEAKFSDVSASGLQVVPASGGSVTGSYTASYTGSYTGSYTPSCALSASPSTITSGQSTTLSWSAQNFRPSTATINPGSMNVDASGSRVVSPTNTTTYTMTMTNPAPGRGMLGGVGGTVTCTATVTVVPASCPNGLNINTYPTCLCPAGQIQSGSTCVPQPATCPNGLNMTTYPTCLCPAGQIQSGSTCITQPVTCPNGLNINSYPSCLCPAGQVQSGSTCITDPGTGGGGCVSNNGASCQSTANACGMRGNGTVQCNGSCSASIPSNAACPSTCWDGSAPGAGGVCPACPAGYTQVGNSCVPPAGPQFVGFPTTKGFNATGHLEVRPSLVRSGDRTFVYWNVTNVRDCTVRGSNGDGQSGGAWNALSSGAAGLQTSPITSRTDYTLFCRSLVGATPSTITETRTVNVLPSWVEPSGQN